MFNDMSQTLVIMLPSATTACTFQMRSDRNFVRPTQVCRAPMIPICTWAAARTSRAAAHVSPRQLRPSSKERISLIPQARMRSARLVGDERGRRP